MEFTFTAGQEAFRTEVRTFIQANWEEPPFVAGDDSAAHAARRRLLHGTVPSTISAGSSEIQRGIIATRGLGLPRG